jgi:hypothetical protein
LGDKNEKDLDDFGRSESRGSSMKKMAMLVILLMLVTLNCSYAQTVEKVLNTGVGKISVTIGIEKTCVKSISVKVDEIEVQTPKTISTICGFKNVSIKEENDMPFIDIRYQHKKTLFYVAETGVWASYQGIPQNRKVDPLEQK